MLCFCCIGSLWCCRNDLCIGQFLNIITLKWLDCVIIRVAERQAKYDHYSCYYFLWSSRTMVVMINEASQHSGTLDSLTPRLLRTLTTVNNNKVNCRRARAQIKKMFSQLQQKCSAMKWYWSMKTLTTIISRFEHNLDGLYLISIYHINHAMERSYKHSNILTV